MISHKLSPTNALPFILAGHALFTIRKIESNGRFTYKVSIPKDVKPEDAKIHFVSVLTGSDNTSDYTYIGYIRNNQFFYGKKSHIKIDAPSVIVFDSVFNLMLSQGKLSSKLEIWHEGKCCRCGRTLTVPESIESGIGPECARKQDKFSNQLNFAI